MKGSLYIAEGESIIVTDQNVKLKSYDVELANSADFLKFPLTQGYRFDYQDHNWILFAEYISMSFCFMTFVIRDKHSDGLNLDDYPFDIEQCNFNINRRTVLTCDNLVSADQETLSQLLKEMEKVDFDLLDQLLYYYEEEIPPEKVTGMRKGAEVFTSMLKSFTINISDLNQKEKPVKKRKVTPTHLAVNNKRSINLILGYLTKLKVTGTD